MSSLNKAFIHGVDQNPVAALAQELGLTLVPMDDCKLLASDGKPVAKVMDQQIQTLWNSVLDQCAEKQQREQQQRLSTNAEGEDSRGETSEESLGEGSSSAESEAADSINVSGGRVHALESGRTRELAMPDAEGKANGMSRSVHDVKCAMRKGKVSGQNQRGSRGGDKLKRHSRGANTRAQTPISLGEVLEETAKEHLDKFSRAERELWGWHRGNLEISCGAVSKANLATAVLNVPLVTWFRIRKTCIGGDRISRHGARVRLKMCEFNLRRVSHIMSPTTCSKLQQYPASLSPSSKA